VTQLAQPGDDLKKQALLEHQESLRKQLEEKKRLKDEETKRAKEEEAREAARLERERVALKEAYDAEEQRRKVRP
jgi:hypothetical protein